MLFEQLLRTDTKSIGFRVSAAVLYLKSNNAVDNSEEMCYHILYRRSNLGVVFANPEFGCAGRQSCVFRCGAFLYPRDCSKLSDPAVKS